MLPTNLAPPSYWGSTLAVSNAKTALGLVFLKTVNQEANEWIVAALQLRKK